MNRIKIQFIANGNILTENDNDMTLKAIEKMKWFLAQECECNFDDIEVVRLHALRDLSLDIDVSTKGLVYFNQLYKGIVSGIECIYDDKDDRFLDAISDGNVEDFIIFTTEN